SAPQRPGPFRRPPRRGRDHLRSPPLSPPDTRRWTRHRSGDPPKGRPLRPLGPAGDAGARTEDRRAARALEPPRSGDGSGAPGPRRDGLSGLQLMSRGCRRDAVGLGLVLAGGVASPPVALALSPPLAVRHELLNPWEVRERFS